MNKFDLEADLPTVREGLGTTLLKNLLAVGFKQRQTKKHLDGLIVFPAQNKLRYKFHSFDLSKSTASIQQVGPGQSGTRLAGAAVGTVLLGPFGTVAGFAIGKKKNLNTFLVIETDREAISIPIKNGGQKIATEVTAVINNAN